MRYFLIDTNDGNVLGNVIVRANTIEEALQLAGNQLPQSEDMGL